MEKGKGNKAKQKRFTLKKYYPDLPIGWGLYSENEIEEKAFWAPFLYASQHFQEKFKAGDKEAIFTFVKNYPECFREIWSFSDGTTSPCYSNNNIYFSDHGRSWVIEQIEKWKSEGTLEARKKLKDLFKAYTDSRGRKPKNPEEDRKLYEFIRKEKDKGGSIEVTLKKLEKELWQIADIEDDRKKLDTLKKFTEKTGMPFEKLKIKINNPPYINKTLREIYFKMSLLKKESTEYENITVKNLRFEYFLPHKGVTIPKKYKERFDKELSLFCDVEWLRIGMINFPRIRRGLSIYSGVRPFEEKRLTLKEALEEVSKEKNIPLDELKEIYSNLQKIHATHATVDILDILKEL